MQFDCAWILFLWFWVIYLLVIGLDLSLKFLVAEFLADLYVNNFALDKPLIEIGISQPNSCWFMSHRSYNGAYLILYQAILHKQDNKMQLGCETELKHHINLLEWAQKAHMIGEHPSMLEFGW